MIDTTTQCPDLVSGIWPSVDHLLDPELIRELSDFAGKADRDGAMSDASLGLLRKSKWPGLAVPKKFEGLGASLVECCAVQRKIGGADPALAIACTMHLGSVGVWAEHYNHTKDMTWVFMEAVATQGLIVASGVAEPGLGGSINRSTLRAKRVEGGWEVTGRKAPMSFSSCADLITLQIQSEPSPDGRGSQVLVALVPRELPGISTSCSWDTMGMRASGSDTLVLERCLIPDPLIVYQGTPGAATDEDLAAGIIWFSLVITASYLGLVEAALKVTRELLNRGRIAHLDAARADLPTFQGLLGQQVASLLTLETACAGIAALMDAGQDRQQLLVAALALKQHAIRVVPEVLGEFAQSSGGAAFSRACPLERLWRDSQAIRFHPPTPVPVAQYLGRAALGLPAALDLDESSPGLHRQLLS